MRALVPFEVAIVLTAAFIALPIPVVIPLLVAGSLSLWVRGRSWIDVLRGPSLYAAVGAAAGLVGLALGLVLGTPLVEGLTGGAVQWSMYPIVRGSPNAAVMLAVLVVIGAVASELVLRGWLVERVLELGGHPVLAILVGAIAEALIVFPLAHGDPGALMIGGDITARIGAGVFGLALGWMYLAAGRSALAPMCARMTFALGALALEAFRLVG
jgi:hypothetical protein